MFEFTIKGVDLQKLQDSLEPVVDKTKQNGRRPYLFEDVCSLELKSYARLIQTTIDLSEKYEIVEGLQNRYKWLNKVSAKILTENVDCFTELYEVPLGKVFMSQKIIDFGNIDLYSLKDLQDYIQNKPIDGDKMCYIEEYNKEFKTSNLLLILLWFNLYMELYHLSNELDVIGQQPEEPIVTLKDIIGSQIDKVGSSLFNVDLPDEVLIAILKGLKEAKWKNNRTMDIGLVADDITEKEWLSLFRATSKNYPLATRKLAWKSVQACKSFVEQLLGKNYKLAETVFCWSDKDGTHPISNLRRIKNDRRDDLCNEKTGLIAKIIKEAKSLMDKNNSNSDAVQS